MAENSVIETSLTLEERVARIEAALAGVLNQPAECQQHRCSYYTQYLAYGPADLEHEGFHAAETLGAEHNKSCRKDWSRGVCAICTDWERRVRA